MGWAKCSLVGISLVPWYGSGDLREGAAEKARIGARGDSGSAGRKQRRLALRPASRVRDAAIEIEDTKKPDGGDQISSFSDELRSRKTGLASKELPPFVLGSSMMRFTTFRLEI